MLGEPLEWMRRYYPRLTRVMTILIIHTSENSAKKFAIFIIMNSTTNFNALKFTYATVFHCFSNIVIKIYQFFFNTFAREIFKTFIENRFFKTNF